MITKEQLLERRAILENELAAHRSTQAAATADIARLEANRKRAYDLENATGGHIQDIDHWLKVIAAAEPTQETKQ